MKYKVIFITSCKPFKNDIIWRQTNAILSWNNLKIDKKIIIVGDRESGVKEFCDNYPFIFNVKGIYSNHTPFLYSLLEEGNKFASDNDIICLINSDIILTQTFVDTVCAFKKKYEHIDKYLLLGQRFDWFQPRKIDVLNLDNILDEIKKESTIHPPYGSDYFIHSKKTLLNFINKNLNFGKPGYDRWLPYNCLKHKIFVCDVSKTINAIHQEHYQFGVKGREFEDMEWNEKMKHCHLYNEDAMLNMELKNNAPGTRNGDIDKVLFKSEYDFSNKVIFKYNYEKFNKELYSDLMNNYYLNFNFDFYKKIYPNLKQYSNDQIFNHYFVNNDNNGLLPGSINNLYGDYKDVSSVCTYATEHHWSAIQIFVVSYYNFNKIPLFIQCDTFVYDKLIKFKTDNPDYEIHLYNELDEYNFKTEAKYPSIDIRNYPTEPGGKWDRPDFRNHKTNDRWQDLLYDRIRVHDYAIEKYGNTLFCDVDFIFVNKLCKFDMSQDVGLTVQFNQWIIHENHKRYTGQYNAGLIFINNKNFNNWYRQNFTKDDFYDQTQLDRAYKDFKVYHTDYGLNYQWSYINRNDNPKQCLDNIKLINDEIYYVYDDNTKFKICVFHIHMYWEINSKRSKYTSELRKIFKLMENSNNTAYKTLLDKFNNLEYPLKYIKTLQDIINYFNIEQVHISKGIDPNTKNNILKYNFNLISDTNKPALFIGLYHSIDINKVLNHKGTKIIFWHNNDCNINYPIRLQIVKKINTLNNIYNICINDNVIKYFNKLQYKIKNLIHFNKLKF